MCQISGGKMKKYTFFYILILLLSALFNVKAQSFRMATDYSYPVMRDVYFLNANIGWFVAMPGDVRKTVDGGLTWSKLPVPSLTDFDTLNVVYFLTEDIGFVGKSANKIFKTTDGGANWSVINVTAGNGYMLYGIYFHDVNRGWLLSSTSSAGQVVGTTDGGATWTVDLNHTTGDLEDMSFFGTSNGIVVGGGVGKVDLFYTTNGTNWTKAPAPTLPAGYTRTDIRGVHMVNQSTAYAVGWGSTVGAQPSIHIKTTDGGATWQYLTQLEQNRTYDNLWAVYFKDLNNGIAVGGATRGSVAVRTNDGGANWIPIEIPCGVSLSTINGFGDDLLITGSSGVVFKTSDFGDTWQLQTPIPNNNLNSIRIINNDLFYAGGFNSFFMKSTNGGVSWKAGFLRAEGYAPNIYGMCFVNENVGYSAHSYGLAAKTTDGGATWKQIIPVTMSATTTLYSPFFLDESYGFIVGKESNNVDIIYKTTNGGLNWETKTNLFATNLRAVAFRDVNNGIVVGEKLKAAYTTNGGNTWTASVFSSLPPGTATPNLLNVKYISGSNAIAVGEQLILLSTNDGATWNYSPVGNLVETINSASFIDANNGWAVGSKTSAPRSVGLYKTTDAGATWQNQADVAIFDTMRALNDVAVTPSGYAWIAAGSSAVYTNSPPSVIRDNDVIPTDFVLEQNYPNPFNPTTKIRFTIPITGEKVILRVFDVLGNTVATLVNEEKSAGTYEVEFSARRGLASGVYYYQLRVGNSMQTKKMMLLR